jgi:hypothetical protein
MILLFFTSTDLALCRLKIVQQLFISSAFSILFYCFIIIAVVFISSVVDVGLRKSIFDGRNGKVYLTRVMDLEVGPTDDRRARKLFHVSYCTDCEV